MDHLVKFLESKSKPVAKDLINHKERKEHKDTKRRKSVFFISLAAYVEGG